MNAEQNAKEKGRVDPHDCGAGTAGHHLPVRGARNSFRPGRGPSDGISRGYMLRIGADLPSCADSEAAEPGVAAPGAHRGI